MLSKKQEKWLREGRGQGELADYKPWIKSLPLWRSLR